MKSLLNKRFSPKRRNKPITYAPASAAKPKPKPKPKPKQLDPPMQSGESSSQKSSTPIPIKSILRPVDGTHEPENKSVRIVESSPHPESVPISTPTRIIVGPLPDGNVSDSLVYNASDLEKGHIGVAEESSPLLESQLPDLTTYQTISPESNPTAQIHCWSTPSLPIPIPPPSSDQPCSGDPVQSPSIPPSRESPFTSPLSRFLQMLYARYPVIITYILITICVIGIIYSLVTGTGRSYLLVIIKACICWIMGTDVARMLFGTQFCDIEFKVS